MQRSRATPAKFSGRSWGRRHSDGLSLRLARARHLEALLRFCRLDPSIGKDQGSSLEFGGPIHHLDPTQVKFRLLISSIFDAMNFQHFLEMLEIMLQHFRKKLELHCIKNARN